MKSDLRDITNKQAPMYPCDDSMVLFPFSPTCEHHPSPSICKPHKPFFQVILVGPTRPHHVSSHVRLFSFLFKDVSNPCNPAVFSVLFLLKFHSH